MNLNKLKSMVQPYNNNSAHPYYRPFVVNDINEQYDIFLVGINPATPIFETDIDLDNYVDLLTNEDIFNKKYERIRKENNKTAKSRTRIGIENFVEDIEKETNKKVLVTNTNFYPTKNEKELRKVEPGAREQGAQSFLEVLEYHLPKVLIVHGRGAIKSLVRILYDNQFIDSTRTFKNSVIALKNADGPFMEFYHPNDKDKKVAVFVCDHLIKHGHQGNSFSFFKDKIRNYLRKELIY